MSDGVEYSVTGPYMVRTRYLSHQAPTATHCVHWPDLPTMLLLALLLPLVTGHLLVPATNLINGSFKQKVGSP